MVEWMVIGNIFVGKSKFEVAGRQAGGALFC